MGKNNGDQVPAEQIDPDMPGELDRLYGDHLWGRGKRGKFLKTFYYPLWYATSHAFRQYRFYKLPKERRLEIVKKIAESIRRNESFMHYPQTGQVIGREKEISIFLNAIYYHVLRHKVALGQKKAPPKVFIVKGEPGSGKSFLIQAVMREAFERAVEEGFICSPMQIEGADLIGMYMGQYSSGTKHAFEAAMKIPSILFIDEAHSMFQKGSAEHGDSASKEFSTAESAMLQSIDRVMRGPSRTLVILSTNSFENIREDVRRRAFLMDLDSPGLRHDDMVKIVGLFLSKLDLQMDPTEVLDTMEQTLRGLGEGKIVPHDIERAFDEVVQESEKPIRESFLKRLSGEDIQRLPINLDSFKKAMGNVRAYKEQALTQSVKEAEQTLPPPDRYPDVGGLKGIKEEIIKEVTLSLHPEKAPEAWIPPRAYLFYGLPGTGKTLLAKAIAGENKVPFFLVKGPSLLAGIVGETEKGVRQLFARARAKAPSIIFMDELDAIGQARGRQIGGNTPVTESALTTLLNELDGFNPKGRIVFVGATNRREMLDPALLERLDKQFEFAYPKSTDEKLDVIKAQWRPYKKISAVTPEQILKVFLKRTFSPRVCADVIKEAARYAMLEMVACKELLTAMDNDDAEEQVKLREVVYGNEFKRIQDRLVQPVVGEDGTKTAPDFDLVTEYQKITRSNPILLSHIEKAFDVKAVTDEDRERMAMQEMHRSRKSEIGTGYGLAVEGPEQKGLFLTLEARIFPAAKPGEGKVTAFGNVGKGAQESAQLAGLVLRGFWKKQPEFDISLQIVSPAEGGEDVAISGPSAGQAMLFTILSAVIREPYNADVCMTGKVDLKGIVGLVGGINPKRSAGKLDAARESGFKICLIPDYAFKELQEKFPDYLQATEEAGTKIIGGVTWLDYAQYVFPDLTTKQLLERLADA